MKELIKNFECWAYELHAKRGYTYGKDSDGNNRPYSYHLIMVGDEAKKRRYSLINREDRMIVNAACAGHDLIEDCGVTPNDIIQILGGGTIAYRIAQTICDVSSPPGMNRIERNLLAYPKIRKNKLATFVKMADNFANTSESKKDQSGMWETYQKEYPIFRYALRSGNKNDSYLPFWNDLDDLHEFKSNTYISTDIMLRAIALCDENHKISLDELQTILKTYLA